MAKGTPGKPAPDPRSIAVCGSLCSSRHLAANNDSPKWRCTISLGSRMAVRFMRAFHFSNKSIYVDMTRSRVSSSSMKGWSKWAMAAVSTHPYRKLSGSDFITKPESAGSVSSNSCTVCFNTGWIKAGAISAIGCKTKRRWCMAG